MDVSRHRCRAASWYAGSPSPGAPGRGARRPGPDSFTGSKHQTENGLSSPRGRAQHTPLGPIFHGSGCREAAWRIRSAPADEFVRAPADEFVRARRRVRSRRPFGSFGARVEFVLARRSSSFAPAVELVRARIRTADGFRIKRDRNLNSVPLKVPSSGVACLHALSWGRASLPRVMTVRSAGAHGRDRRGRTGVDSNYQGAVGRSDRISLSSGPDAAASCRSG